jgi:hypothetical protein
LVASATLVAVTVAFVLTVTVGAWYRPLLEILPLEADHVTATLDVLLTRAVNCRVPADGTEAVAGETVTTTAGGVDDDELAGTEMPEQAAKKRSEDTKATRIVHWRKLARCGRRPILAGGSAWCSIKLPHEMGFRGMLNI